MSSRSTELMSKDELASRTLSSDGRERNTSSPRSRYPQKRLRSSRYTLPTTKPLAYLNMFKSEHTNKEWNLERCLRVNLAYVNYLIYPRMNYTYSSALKTSTRVQTIHK